MVTRVAWGATVTTVSVSSSVALLAGSMPNPIALGPLGVAVCNARLKSLSCYPVVDDQVNTITIKQYFNTNIIILIKFVWILH